MPPCPGIVLVRTSLVPPGWWKLLRWLQLGYNLQEPVKNVAVLEAVGQHTGMEWHGMAVSSTIEALAMAVSSVRLVQRKLCAGAT
jgi:hypothetical protein